MSQDINTLNSYLKAKTSDNDAKSIVSVTAKQANDGFIADVSTLMGVVDVGDAVNGYQSLANNDIMTASGGVTSAGVPVLLSNAAFDIPSSNPNLFFVDVSSGTFTVIDSAGAIQILVNDSAGEPIEDSAGNPITVPSFEVPSLNVTSVGTSAVSTLNETIGSLTGITPPTEAITIVSLGGGAVSQLTGAIKEATERKSSLLSSIKETAAATSVEGLGESVTSSIDEVKGVMDNVTNSSTLTEEVMGSVSAVEGLANDIASSVATEKDSLIGKLESTIGEVTSAIEDGFTDIIGDVTGAVNDLVSGVIPDIQTDFGFAQNLFEDLTGAVGSTLQGIFGSTTTLDKRFLSGILNDVLSGGDINLTKAAKALSLRDTTLSPQMREVIETTNAESIQDFDKIVSSRAAARGIPQREIDKFKSKTTEIETALSKVDTTISGTIVSEVGDFYVEDKDLAELVKRYLGASTENFEFVDSKEELGLEFRKVTRSVSEVIVHATETYTNANIGSEEIHLRHNEAGHDGIQYHYVIRRDGRLQRGMPIDNISVASQILGHNINCIDVALVGGVNVPSDAGNPLLNLSSSSFTQTQMKTLESLLEVFYRNQPGGQVLGHNAIDINSQDPYFDVITFVENKFGKKSVYKDPLTEQSISAKDLISKRPV